MWNDLEKLYSMHSYRLPQNNFANTKRVRPCCAFSRHVSFVATESVHHAACMCRWTCVLMPREATICCLDAGAVRPAGKEARLLAALLHTTLIVELCTQIAFAPFHACLPNAPPSNRFALLIWGSPQDSLYISASPAEGRVLLTRC